MRSRRSHPARRAGPARRGTPPAPGHPRQRRPRRGGPRDHLWVPPHPGPPACRRPSGGGDDAPQPGLGRPCDPRSWRRLAAPSAARAPGGACRPMSVQMHVRTDRPHAHCGGRRSVVTVSYRYRNRGRREYAMRRERAAARAAHRVGPGLSSPASRMATVTPWPIRYSPRGASTPVGSPPGAAGSSRPSHSPHPKGHPVPCAGDLTTANGAADRIRSTNGRRRRSFT